MKDKRYFSARRILGGGRKEGEKKTTEHLSCQKNHTKHTKVKVCVTEKVYLHSKF